ncbi:laccase [Lanmaoa asiatica]|nr:laccase [Lanmaoa asiatica]
MYLLLVFAFSFFSITHAASIISRANTSPLPSLYAVGPATNLTISNGMIAPDGFLRSTTLAGGTFPGPLIAADKVCPLTTIAVHLTEIQSKGDRFVLNVVNELKDSEMWLSTSVHWHGLFQNGTNYVDGTSFVTQCPISQNHSFVHKFTAGNQAGTFWYHSHYSSQTCDGLRGPIVIYDPDDPYRHLYDVDDETTVITLADWYAIFRRVSEVVLIVSRYHINSPVLNYFIGVNANSTLINGLGRYTGGPASELAVVNVQQGKRYRFRLVAMSCDPNFTFSIDGHNFTVIEADGISTEPLLVDSIQIYAGQRYSIIMNATQPVGNYWIRALPSTPFSTFTGGANSAILRYNGAPSQDPTTVQTPSVLPLLEPNLHTLVNPGAPGVPGYGNADMNLEITALNLGGVFYMNGTRYRPPTVPVLLQILSGAQQASDLLPNGSVIVLEPNKVIELTVKIAGIGGPVSSHSSSFLYNCLHRLQHPIHLHGHAFDVVQSAGPNAVFNYQNPVRRDVASAGTQGQQMVIRFVTDNSGPWFLHWYDHSSPTMLLTHADGFPSSHIDWHLEAGFAIVMAENPAGVQDHLGKIPGKRLRRLVEPVTYSTPSEQASWYDLCPIYDSLSPSQIGAPNALQEAENITTLILPS